MKKLLFPLIVFLLPFIAMAQTNLVFDLSKNEFDPVPQTITTNAVINIACTHPEVLGDQPTLHYHITDATGKIYDQSRSAHLNMPINLTRDMAGFGGDLTFTISREVGKSLKLLKQFVVKDNSGNYVGNAQTQITNVYFNKPAALGAITLPSAYNGYKVVIYDPCANTYKIYNKGKERNALWFRPFSIKNNGNGVIFLIKNFNTLKYDITVSSTFTNRFTTVPDLFTSVLSLISSAAAPAAAAPQLPDEIVKIMQMNTDLKNVINMDCADFGQIKSDIQNNAMLNFGGNGMVSIDGAYNVGKAAIIAARQPGLVAPAKYGVPEFNAEFQTALHLPVTPDSVVKETITLYNQIMSTEFRFQSNIVQLQNVDEIGYTLTIAGKTNVKNTTINVNAQPLNIPVLGGIKVDFSTGLYYSNVKNQTYALRKNTTTDTTKNDIINEGNYNGRTLGVAALAHIYPRLFTGINPTLTVGLGKSLDMNYAILLGGSLMVGRLNHFAISGGLNIANIKMLSKAYIDGTGQRIPQPVSLTSVNTYNGYKRGAFLSFTYAFGSASATTQTASAAPSAAAATTAAATPSGSGKSK